MDARQFERTSAFAQFRGTRMACSARILRGNPLTRSAAPLPDRAAPRVRGDERGERADEECADADDGDIARDDFRGDAARVRRCRRERSRCRVTSESQSSKGIAIVMSVMPRTRPVRLPKKPTNIPCARKTQTICAVFAPSAFRMPISRRLLHGDGDERAGDAERGDDDEEHEDDEHDVALQADGVEAVAIFVEPRLGEGVRRVARRARALRVRGVGRRRWSSPRCRGRRRRGCRVPARRRAGRA